MRSARGLHKLFGSRFLKAKVGLCDQCLFRRDYYDWEGFCTARDKILSTPKPGTKKGRCPAYTAKMNDEAVS
jgi:hypothetical protein